MRLGMIGQRVPVLRLVLAAAAVLPMALLGLALSLLFLGTLEGPPATRLERSQNAVQHLLGLRQAIRHQDVDRLAAVDGQISPGRGLGKEQREETRGDRESRVSRVD